MPRILAIDDDRIIRTIVEKSLTALGYQVVTVASGEEGLQKIKAIQPDLVITDKMMPGINGYEVTRRLRLEPEYAHLPILVLTSESELSDKLDAFEAGADDYLSKPFEAAELAARIHSLLRRAEAFHAAQEDKLQTTDNAEIIAVHSLRGGIGCSSIAVNLAVAFAQLWQSPTLITDMNLSVGQIGLLLNTSIKRNWADLVQFNLEDIDHNLLARLMGKT
jgi:pilus assembly protein CpaE